jgi:hypothetical protein
MKGSTMTRGWLWLVALALAFGVLYLPRLDIGWGQVLTFLVLLLCPLMHFLGGHGHGGHDGHDGHGRGEPRASRPAPPETRKAK